LEFNFLTPLQLKKIFISYCNELKLTPPTESELHEISRLREITPGDFATIARQSRFRKIETTTEFTLRLKEEIRVKKLESGHIMGFVN
jgi:hypothetical protein